MSAVTSAFVRSGARGIHVRKTALVLQVQIPHASCRGLAARVTDDERYLRACMRYTDQVYRMFIGARLINKVFARVFQSHAMGRLVIAHFEAEARTDARRPTVAWLQAQTGCGRTLAAFIGIAKVFGLVMSAANPVDRREKYLIPGRPVVEGLRDWLAHHFVFAEAIGILPTGSADRLHRDADYFERFVRSSLPVIDGIAGNRRRFGQWQWFEDRECGLRIAYAYLNAHCAACLRVSPCVDAPIWFEISGERVAQSLGVSKSHVRNVINGAEGRGILDHDLRRRRARFSADFLAEARGSLHALLRSMADAHRRAERLPRRTRSPRG